MISVQGVSKSFGSQVVLRDVSLEIEEGQTTTVVGPSGVGKSVLLKLIMGILDPDEGEIFIDGRNITRASTEWERNDIRACLGVLFQSAALFDSLTVYDNIAFPLIERRGALIKERLTRDEVKRRVIDIMKSLSLERHSVHFPEEIPIGMRKRVGLARCLITQPQVILIDEPNTGLDPLVGQEVYDLIQSSQKEWGFTAVVISHELPEVFQVSDRVVMLLGGGIVFEGSPQEMNDSAEPAVQQFLHGSLDGPIQIQ